MPVVACCGGEGSASAQFELFACFARRTLEEVSADKAEPLVARHFSRSFWLFLFRDERLGRRRRRTDLYLRSLVYGSPVDLSEWR